MSIPFLFLLSMVLTTLTAGVLTGFLGSIARRDIVARAMSRASLAVTMWAFFYALWQWNITNHPLALLFIQIAVIWIVLITAFYIDFAARFAESISGRVFRHYRVLGYILGILFIGLVFFDIFAGTRFIVGTAGPKFWFSYWPDPGLFFEPFLLYFTGGFAFAFFLLLSLRKNASREVKAQINYLVFSNAMAVAGGTTLFIIWYNVPIPPLGGLIVPIYVIASFYAITKHHLFNVKVITAELLTFSVWAIMLARVLLATTPQERWNSIANFIIIFFLGYFIIRSVLNEVNQRERAEELTIKLNSANAELKDLNDNLQQKVSEQTEEIRKAYEVEKKARIELEDLDKAKDQFILTTQHHLRTPLTIVKGFIQTILGNREKKRLDDETVDQLSKTLAASDRMSHLINDFLNISQIEVGKSVFQLEPINVQEIVEEIKQEVSSDIEKKKLYFTIAFHSDVDRFRIVADHKAIKLALYNLIDNSVKYTPHGGITATGSIVEHPIEKGKALRLVIQDTGIGIPKEELPKLFDRYFQRGTEAEKIYTTGRGIGLVVAKNIIKAHHGTITAYSEGADRGSSFIIELPCEPV